MTFALIFMSGCSSQNKVIPEELKKVHFNQQLLITNEDEDKYIAEITFENKTNYDFRPTAVFVNPQIRYIKDGVDTLESNPIFLRADEIDVDNTSYKYKVEIPKKIFDVYEHMSKERVVVIIEGQFTKNDQLILGVSIGEDTKLAKKDTK